MAKYDRIGIGYHNYREPDPRLAECIHKQLNGARRVLNVGAGVGSYEPADAQVIALEPSQIMIQQRARESAPVIQAVAESLPFADDQFDAVMGVLTLHHWADKIAGLRECLRVARDRVVFLSWLGFDKHFWLFDYFPEIKAIDAQIFPTLEWMEEMTGADASAEVFPIPADCSDGFLCAYWARPEAYLDSKVRRSISTFAVLDRVEERIQKLADDLDSGVWHQRNGHILQNESMDYGYRLVTLQSK
jgi:SAM-dependent methyltransferase